MKKEREGKKENGKYYLRVGKAWVEVDETVYYGYMRLVWKEEKQEERRNRCFLGSKRCDGNCEECPYERSGAPLSLDALYESNEYEPAAKQKSVENQVLEKFLHEALYSAIDNLSLENKVLLHDMYFSQTQLSQRQIARKLHISQVSVHKRHQKLLDELRVKLEDKIRG